jgi:hypothetical protein
LREASLGGGEKGAEVHGQLSRFIFRLVSGDAYNLEAMGAEPPIPLPVLSEGSLGAVGLEGVELADQAGLGPEAVDLVAVLADLEPGVEPRPRDSMVVKERQK